MENTENIGALPPEDTDVIIKKSNRATKERMKELNDIKKKKNEIKKAEKEELKKKLEEIEKIKKEKIELEYQQALKMRSRLPSAKKSFAHKQEEEEEEEPPKVKKVPRAPQKKKKIIIEEEEEESEDEPEPTILREPSAKLYKIASRDILKDKYIEEVKKRVMRDLFS